MENLSPRQVVAELDKYIVGQDAAKRAVAVALRNRYRRAQLPPEVRRDVLPKNILMIGPTGVGKTEIARQVAHLLDAPFIKVEATRFTEAGYVGQDVETIVFDLVEAAIDMVHETRMKVVQDRAEGLAKERLIGYLFQQMNNPTGTRRRAGSRRRSPRSAEPVEPLAAPVEPVLPAVERKQVATMLEAAQLDDTMVEIELSAPTFGLGLEGPYDGAFSGEGDGMEGSVAFAAPQKRVRRVPVKEARRLLVRDEANKLVDWDEVIDEIDKIVGPRIESGSDVSGEGVQRDLLPIVEGSAVMTRFGPVKTDHMLFIAAGAFYHHKPSELIPELQGRFPIRVELESLSREAFRKILTDTRNSLITQARLLLATEGVDLVVTDDAVDRLAEVAMQVNETTENIGARRLQTVLERVLEEVSFEASEHNGQSYLIDAAYVDARVQPLLANVDLTRYIL